MFFIWSASNLLENIVFGIIKAYSKVGFWIDEYKIPPFFKIFVAENRPLINSVSSLLTNILKAWKVLVAGSFVCFAFFCFAALIMEASSFVFWIGFLILFLTIAFTI